MLNILLGLCGLVLLILAAVVVYSDPRASSNRWLGVFLAGTFEWLVANLLTNVATTSLVALIFARVSLVGASLVPLAFLMFCYHFIAHNKLKLPKRLIVYVPVLLLILTVPTNWNVISISAHGRSFRPGIAYVGLLIIAVIYFGIGTGMIVREYRRADMMRRQQLYYILIGTALTLLPVIVVSALLPLMGYSSAAGTSPLFVVFFAGFTTYAIIRHRLFDVRLVVARALAYILSLGVIAGSFIVASYAFIDIIPYNFATKNSVLRSAYSILAVVLALFFPKIKTFFDKQTNRIFYQDAYDSQAFLDEFNKVLISTYELTPLLQRCARVIEHNLKSSFCVFGIKESVQRPQKVVGASEYPAFTAEDIAIVRRLTPHLRRKVIVTDMLEPNYSNLAAVLRRNNISVLARLSTNRQGEEGIGYLVLGSKKSGNQYSAQDIRFIEIIANELVLAIENALRFEEIEAFNVNLQQNVSEATKKLRRTNERLKVLDETKDEFISMASHQLRTPLTSVKGYLSMVLEGDVGKLNKQQEQMLTQSYLSSQRMVYLISDLLNLSRLNTGKFVIEPSPVDLREVVKAEMGQLTETAKARNITMNYQDPESLPELLLDETKIHQVVMNFMDNAIYYTPSGGHVDIELIETPTAVEYRVVDNGIGVPRAVQKHLFSKFYRADNARKARPDGTGLGLFMAKKVIAAQGGAVIFESVEGKGSTFGFRFSKTGHLAPAKPTPEKELIAA